MNQESSPLLADTDPGESLSWENLGQQSPWRAFWESLYQLLIHPVRFFDRMATEGGLREPLLLFWLIVGTGVLLSFPIALAHFGLTAPDAAAVSPDAYARHLLPPRVTGFVTILLPVILLIGGVALVVSGTIFHLAARLFGAHNWEGSVSIWCYAQSAGASALVAAQTVLCVISVTCYLVTLVLPGASESAARVSTLSLRVVGSAAVVAAIGWLFISLIIGCIRVFGLDPAGGVAAALAGILLVVGVAFSPVVGWIMRGPAAGAVALGLNVLLLAALAVVGQLLLTPAPREVTA